MDKNSKSYTFFSFGESKIARIVNEPPDGSIIEEGNGIEVGRQQTCNRQKEALEYTIV
jgi:hypothetical protein